MKLHETRVGNSLPICCKNTVESLNPNKNYKEGMIIKCHGDDSIMLKDGIWVFNPNYTYRIYQEIP